MPDDAPPVYRYGDIVIVSQMLDPNGVNPKDRPCVIIDDPKSPPQAGFHRVVAITTVVPDPLPDGYVLLPYQLPRHPKTRLNRRNAAVCPWVEIVDESRLRAHGFVPGSYMLRIAIELDRLAPPPE